EAHLAQDLDRADLEVAGARVDGRAGVALDDERLDAVRGEQRRGREPYEAAADDQNGRVVSPALRLTCLRCGCHRRARLGSSLESKVTAFRPRRPPASTTAPRLNRRAR